MASTTYLVVGEDEFSVTAKTKEIIAGLLSPEQQSLGLDTIEGRVDTVDAAVDALARTKSALRTVGFLGVGRVVWLRDVSFFVENQVGRSDVVRARTDELADVLKQGLPAGQALVITAQRVDGRLSIFKACKAVGEIHDFQLPKKVHEIEKMALERAGLAFREAGLRPTRDVLGLFLEKVGTDTRQIVNEVEKLSLFMGGKDSPDMDDVLAIVSSSRATLVWDLADAVGQRQLGRALDILRQLVFQKEEPMFIIISLESRFRDIELYHAAVNDGWLKEGRGSYSRPSWEWRKMDEAEGALLIEAFGKDPRTTHPYRVGLLAAQAVALSPQEIRRCRSILLRAHEKLVTTNLDPVMVIEVAIIKILSENNRKHPRAPFTLQS